MKQQIAVMLILGCIVNCAVGSQVYRCVIDGELVFSQIPCEEDAERVHFESHPGQSAPVASDGGLQTPSDSGLSSAEENTRYVERLRIERRIGRHERKIQQLQRSRDSELAALRARMQRAANNQAGATWIQGISTEMQAVTDSYTSQIEVEQRQIDRLRDDMARLE